MLKKTTARLYLLLALPLLSSLGLKNPGPALADDSRLQALAVIETGSRRFCSRELQQAIERDDLDLVTAFLDAGWHPDQALDFNRTRPLHIAGRLGKSAIVRLLLARGAPVNSLDVWKRTPLMNCGSGEVREILLRAGADYHLRDFEGKTVMHLACSGKDNLPAVKRLLAAGVPADDVDAKGNTPLMLAAQAGATDTLAALLEKLDAGQVNRCNQEGFSALRSTFFSKNDAPACARLLLEHGADPLAVHEGKSDLEWGWSPLEQTPACSEIEKHLLEKNPRSASAWLAKAILYERLDFCRRLIAAGAPIGSLDLAPRLYWAASTGDIAILANSRQELDRRNFRDKRDRSLMERAARYGQIEVVRWLLGIKPGWTDGLHDAAQNGQAEIVEILLNAGAGANIRNFQGYHPLHLAAQNGHLQAALLLLARGADAKAQNNWGLTPLLLAVRSGNAPLVKALIQAGADVNSIHQGEGTALLAAVEAGNVTLVSSLIKAGANPYLTHKHHERSAALIAAGRGNPELIKLLRPACTRQNAELAQKLNVNSETHLARLDLYQAIEAGRVKTLQNLLAIGVGPKIGQNGHTRSPIAEAAARRQLEILDILIRAGFEASNSEHGPSPLLCAIIHPSCWQPSGWGEVLKETPPSFADLSPDPKARIVIERLVRTGTDVNAQDSYGRTALFVAARFGHSEAAEALIAAGAKLDHVSENGECAATVAAREGNVAVLKALLQAGAEPDGKGEINPLLAAAQSGQWHSVHILLDHEAKAAELNQAGFTPLMLARRARQLETVKRLYAAMYPKPWNLLPQPQPDFNEPWDLVATDEYAQDFKNQTDENNGDETPSLFQPTLKDYLLDSLRAGRSEIILEAIAKDYLSRLGSLAEALLSEAVRCEEIKILQALLAAQTKATKRLNQIVTLRDERYFLGFPSRLLTHFGRQALMVAILRNYPQAAECLLNAGVDGRSPYPPAGLTPLHLAAEQSPELIRLLLRHGADPVTQWSSEDTRNDMLNTDHARMFEIDDLREQGNNMFRHLPPHAPPLAVALMQGSEENVNLLLEAGNQTDVPTLINSLPFSYAVSQNPLLHFTAATSDLPRLRLLLRLGGDANLPDAEGQTPLIHAVRFERMAAALILLAAGADPGQADNKGRNAWHHAAGLEHVEQIRALSHCGRHRAVSGAEPLVHSFLYKIRDRDDLYDRQCEVLKALLEAGADANERDKAGLTPLLLAMQRNHHQAFRLLLQHGADPRRPGPGGQTALHLALKTRPGEDLDRRQLFQIAYLVKHGADIGQKDLQGKSPLDLATDPEVRDILLQNVLLEEYGPRLWEYRIVPR